jgi:ribosomal protein S27E
LFSVNLQITLKWSDLMEIKCSICKAEIIDNVNPEKIITCARCVQKLLAASKEVKIQTREIFLQRGNEEAARSIQSFIVEEIEDGNLRPVVERKRVSKSVRHINSHFIRVSEKGLSVGKHRRESLLS